MSDRMGRGGEALEQVRWGIIGCGEVTEVKSGPALQKVGGSELVAVMRRTGEKARDYARRHGVPRWYDDAEALLHDPDVNAIYVATPPSSHAEYVIRAAQAGKPVYVEKPMALNYGECVAMIEACHAAGVPLFVAYYRRALPRFLKVKELVETGAIGEVRFVSVALYYPPREGDRQSDTLPWRVRPEVAGGGHFFDLGSHQLDLLDDVFGPIVSARGFVANQAGLYPAEDVVAADFAFGSGVLGSGIWCFTVSEASRTERTEIVGSRGRISFSFFEPAPIRLETAEGVEAFEFSPPQHIQQPLIQTVVDELRGQGRCPSTGSSAARTSRIMDEIVTGWRLAQQGREAG
jgi:predicted dehydrogenase